MRVENHSDNADGRLSTGNVRGSSMVDKPVVNAVTWAIGGAGKMRVKGVMIMVHDGGVGGDEVGRVRKPVIYT